MGDDVERRLVRDVWSAARHVRSGLGGLVGESGSGGLVGEVGPGRSSRLVGEVGVEPVGMWGRDRGLLREVRGAVMRRACAARNVEGDAARDSGCYPAGEAARDFGCERGVQRVCVGRGRFRDLRLLWCFRCWPPEVIRRFARLRRCLRSMVIRNSPASSAPRPRADVVGVEADRMRNRKGDSYGGDVFVSAVEVGSRARTG